MNFELPSCAICLEDKLIKTNEIFCDDCNREECNGKS